MFEFAWWWVLLVLPLPLLMLLLPAKAKGQSAALRVPALTLALESSDKKPSKNWFKLNTCQPGLDCSGARCGTPALVR